MTLNPYILLVMKWLDDKNSVSREELRKNADDTVNVTDTTDAIVADTAFAAYKYPDYIEYWINKYFETTEENKQNYIDQIEKDKK